MANTNFFVVKNGLAVGNTTSTKHVINNAGQWIGDPTGVIQNSYDQANGAFNLANTLQIFTQSAYDSGNNTIIFSQAAFDKANTDETLAQAAFDKANNAGGFVALQNDETTDASLYVNFTDSTTGDVSTLKTSQNNLTFNPSSGTLMVRQLDVTPYTNIYSGEVTIDSTSPTTFDSFDANLYRSAFYQVQLEYGGSFHALNINIINTGSAAVLQSYGDVYNEELLATFSVNVVGGLVVVQIAPINSGTIVSYLRNAIVRKTTGVPMNDLGWILDSITSTFDAGFDLQSVTSSFDYGTL